MTDVIVTGPDVVKPILLLMSLGQMLLSPFYLFVIMVHDVTEPVDARWSPGQWCYGAVT